MDPIYLESAEPNALSYEKAFDQWFEDLGVNLDNDDDQYKCGELFSQDFVNSIDIPLAASSSNLVMNNNHQPHSSKSDTPRSESGDSSNFSDSACTNFDSGLEVDTSPSVYRDRSYSSDAQDSPLYNSSDCSRLSNNTVSQPYSMDLPDQLSCSSIYTPSLVTVPGQQNDLLLAASDDQSLTAVLYYTATPEPNFTNKTIVPQSFSNIRPKPPVIANKMYPFVAASSVSRKSERNPDEEKMVRNRQSAQLSRQKHKDYVKNLEVKVDHLEKENEELKLENSNLKKSNDTLNAENQKFRKTIKLAQEIRQPDKKRLKIEFDKKSLFAKIPVRLVVNKNAACLMTLLVVCVVNMGPYWTYFNPQKFLQQASQKQNYVMTSPEKSIGKQTPLNNQTVNRMAGRNLLAIRQEKNKEKEAYDYYYSYNSNENDVNSSSEKGPKYNFSSASSEQENDQNVKQTGKKLSHSTVKNATLQNQTFLVANGKQPNCNHSGPMYGNSTESIRLRDELNQWILGENNRMKRLIFDRNNNDKDSPHPPSFPGENSAQFSRQVLVDQFNSNNRNDNERNGGNGGGGQNSLSKYYRRKYLETLRRRNGLNNQKIWLDMKYKSVEKFFQLLEDLSSAKSDEKTTSQHLEDHYARILSEFRRRNDTLYVFSFREDYLLLPASDNSTTSRPKMSLLMPTTSFGGWPQNLDANIDFMPMVQIECEITNFLKWPDYHRANNSRNSSATNVSAKINSPQQKLKSKLNVTNRRAHG